MLPAGPNTWLADLSLDQAVHASVADVRTSYVAVLLRSLGAELEAQRKLAVHLVKRKP
jgi:hypothetical protein